MFLARRTIHMFLYGTLVLLLCAGVLFVQHNHTLFADTTTAAVAARKAQLEQELKTLEKLIAQQQTLLNQKQGERVSLERDVAILDAEIEKARLNIRASEVAIAELEGAITEKEKTIETIAQEIDREKASLAQILRRTAEMDDVSLVEMVLSEQTMSEFFEEMSDFEEIKLALHTSFVQLEGLRDEHDVARLALEEEREAELGAKAIRQQQERKLASQEQEKTRILEVTKGEEQNYQQLLAANRKKASDIRNLIFELQGSANISLGQAIELANMASAKTGVRAAFILGVLKQETDIGSFLGSCTYDQIRFGKGVMKPDRDAPVYLVIAQTLGFDPSSRPISCSQTANTWGGAMGPSQFIPSTWACFGGYYNTRTGDCNNALGTMSRAEFYLGPWAYDAKKDRLRQLRGKQSPSNPWDNQDAFLATALYMQELGAAYGTFYSEHLAAMRYFAGWAGANNPSHTVRLYGDDVMNHASYFQRQMDTLKELETE
jgi:membrane-bound lytic murein transglycosylase B